MSNLSVCVVCLASYVKMYNLDKFNRRADFNAVTCLNTYRGSGLPPFLCCQCFALLAKFQQFRERSQKSNFVLNEIKRKKKQLTIDDINEIDKAYLGTNSKLSFMTPQTSGLFEIEYDSTEYDSFEHAYPVKVDDELFMCSTIIPGKADDETTIKTENIKFEESFGNDFEDDYNYGVMDFDANCNENDNDIKNDNGNEAMEGDGTITDDNYATAVELSELHQKVAHEIYLSSRKGRYKCTECSYGSNVKADIDQHIARHEKYIRGMHCCELCLFYYRTDKLLQVHLRTHHLYKYLCNYCPEVSYNSTKARYHYTLLHMKNKMVERVRRKKIKSPKQAAKRKIEYSSTVPKNFFIMSTVSPQEQYAVVESRKLTKNYQSCAYKCELCFKGFNNTVTLANHQKRHDPSFAGPLQCDICKCMFSDTKKMYHHLNITHMYNYKCRLCDFASYNTNRALRHYKWHNNIKYSCPDCNLEFQSSGAFQTHYRFNHPKLWSCSYCGNSYNKEVGLRSHKMLSHGKQVIEEHEYKMANEPELDLYCVLCCVQFGSHEAYNKHLTTSNRHVDISKSKPQREPRQRKKPIEKSQSDLNRKGISICTTCDECGIVLPNATQIAIHYKTDHPGVVYTKRFMCDICGHNTKLYNNLQTHMRVHTDERPFQCKYCDKSFHNASNRDRHVLVHTGVKKYQCQYCNKRFTQNCILKLHIQTVHFKIPYAPWVNRQRKRKRLATDYEQLETKVIMDEHMDVYLSYNNQ